MEHDNSMSDRILRKLEDIINSDTELKDFTIVITEENTRNKCPVLYAEHSLGLESWCVKHVYQYVCAELFETRAKLAKGKLAFEKMKSLNKLLIGALLINTDVATFWAMRRELIESDVLSIEEELFFSKIVLTYKSKSNETFSHRKWLLNKLFKKCKHDQTFIINKFEEEFAVTEMAAGYSANNYHCWNHRIWCMENLVNKLEPSIVLPIIEKQLQFSSKWIQLHVSEHTGYHYRQYLINLSQKNEYVAHISQYYFKRIKPFLKVIKDSVSTLNFLMPKLNLPEKDLANTMNVISLLLYDLLCLTNNLNFLFDGHESLWYHRRFIIYKLIKLIYNSYKIPFQFKQLNCTYKHPTCCNFVESCLYSQLTNVPSSTSGEKLPKIIKYFPIKFESPLYTMIVNWERDFIRQNKENINNLIQVEFAKRHEKWLLLFLNINLE